MDGWEGQRSARESYEKQNEEQRHKDRMNRLQDHEDRFVLEIQDLLDKASARRAPGSMLKEFQEVAGRIAIGIHRRDEVFDDGPLVFIGRKLAEAKDSLWNDDLYLRNIFEMALERSNLPTTRTTVNPFRGWEWSGIARPGARGK